MTIKYRRNILSVAAVAVFGLVGNALAQELPSPEGTWEIDSRDSRYEVQMCGEDQNQLCGTLVWLGRGADNAENRQYLDTMIIDHAPAVGENQWRGRLHLFGHTANGTITQTDDDVIELEGCAFMVICRSYTLFRI